MGEIQTDESKRECECPKQREPLKQVSKQGEVWACSENGEGPSLAGSEDAEASSGRWAWDARLQNLYLGLKAALKAGLQRVRGERVFTQRRRKCLTTQEAGSLTFCSSLFPSLCQPHSCP